MRASELAYRVAVRSGWARLRRGRGRGAVIFCFHNVVADATAYGEAALHLRRADFSAHLDLIRALYRVVPLAELGQRLSRGSSLDGLAALTFDDAYHGFFAHAVPELAARALPATVFVVTEAAEWPDLFWWDRVAGREGLSAELRQRCLTELGGDETRIRGLAAVPAQPPPGGELVAADWSEIAAALGDLLAVGSHTVTHRNLARLAEPDVDRELVRSRERIGERLGRAPEYVSYPYGLVSEAARRGARRAGYAGGCTLERGIAGPGSDRYALPRVNVPAGISLAGLECWAAGIAFRRD